MRSYFIFTCWHFSLKVKITNHTWNRVKSGTCFVYMCVNSTPHEKESQNMWCGNLPPYVDKKPVKTSSSHTYVFNSRENLERGHFHSYEKMPVTCEIIFGAFICSKFIYLKKTQLHVKLSNSLMCNICFLSHFNTFFHIWKYPITCDKDNFTCPLGQKESTSDFSVHT